MRLNHIERTARKRLLVARSAVLRLSLARQLDQGLQPAWRTLDRVDQGRQWVQRNPWLLVGVGALLLVWKPRAIPAAATRLWDMWRTWQRIAPTALPIMTAVLTATRPESAHSDDE